MLKIIFKVLKNKHQIIPLYQLFFNESKGDKINFKAYSFDKINVQFLNKFDEYHNSYATGSC